MFAASLLKCPTIIEIFKIISYYFEFFEKLQNRGQADRQTNGQDLLINMETKNKDLAQMTFANGLLIACFRINICLS